MKIIEMSAISTSGYISIARVASNLNNCTILEDGTIVMIVPANELCLGDGGWWVNNISPPPRQLMKIPDNCNRANFEMWVATQSYLSSKHYAYALRAPGYKSYPIVGRTGPQISGWPGIVMPNPKRVISDYPHQCPQCAQPAYVGMFEVSHQSEKSAKTCMARRGT